MPEALNLHTPYQVFFSWEAYLDILSLEHELGCSTHSPLRPEYPLVGAIYCQFRVTGGSWKVILVWRMCQRSCTTERLVIASMAFCRGDWWRGLREVDEFTTTLPHALSHPKGTAQVSAPMRPWRSSGTPRSCSEVVVCCSQRDLTVSFVERIAPRQPSSPSSTPTRRQFWLCVQIFGELPATQVQVRGLQPKPAT